MIFNFANISHLNAGTVIVDAAAVFLLLGMIYQTALFRRRGRTDDRIFFWMILTNILLAVCDGLNYSMEGSPNPLAGKLIIAGDTVFTLAFETFSVLLACFVDYRAYKDTKGLKKRSMLYAIPAVVTGILVLVNPFTGILFSMDSGNIYHFGDWYNLIFVAPVIMAIIVFLLLWKTDRFMAVFFVAMIGIRLIAGVIVRGISLTGFFFALVLAYTHIRIMNHAFYEEEES
ncbi:MAG: hypothetical protein K6F53_07365 [Lachnospiraceae bacterium]|nr:hypothetical protein [Lachnospiraceae bacterium]